MYAMNRVFKLCFVAARVLLDFVESVRRLDKQCKGISEMNYFEHRLTIVCFASINSAFALSERDIFLHG